MSHVLKIQTWRKSVMTGICAVSLLAWSTGFAAEMLKSGPFKGINKGRTTMVALADFTPLQGGVPIVYEGQVIGAIGVSGAASAQQDEEIAIAGANAVRSVEEIAQAGLAGIKTGGAKAAPAGVTYFPSKQVSRAFVKGAPLIEVLNYKVHASHRDEPGIAEIHTRDTDIIYVLEGSATFVTGGTAVDAKMIEPEEIRGKEIRGGESRKLVKGDIIIVPNGVPHWFKDVEKPFNYYVVKVRSESEAMQ